MCSVFCLTRVFIHFLGLENKNQRKKYIHAIFLSLHINKGYIEVYIGISLLLFPLDHIQAIGLKCGGTQGVIGF